MVRGYRTVEPFDPPTQNTISTFTETVTDVMAGHASIRSKHHCG